MIKFLLPLTLLVIISSCQSKQQEGKQVSNIDSTLQVKATSILENKLTELNALSGQAIIMEVQTGHIKAMVGVERKIVQTTYLARTFPKHTNQH